VQENEEHAELFQTPGAAMRDARTGEILWSHSPVIDVPSGVVADIDPRHKGYEVWGGPGGLRNAQGESIGNAPRDTGWSIWWDGDLLRELVSLGRPDRRPSSRRRADNRGGQNQQPATDTGQPIANRPSAEQQANDRRENRDERDTQIPPTANGAEEAALAAARARLRRRAGPQPTRISKWNWQQQEPAELETLEGVTFSRGPNIQGDLIGDWREELLLCAPDGKSLRLYTTTIPTALRLPTLLHDPQYRLGLVWQNVVYSLGIFSNDHQTERFNAGKCRQSIVVDLVTDFPTLCLGATNSSGNSNLLGCLLRC
jgi:hypothetical protein